MRQRHLVLNFTADHSTIRRLGRVLSSPLAKRATKFPFGRFFRPKANRQRRDFYTNAHVSAVKICVSQRTLCMQKSIAPADNRVSEIVAEPTTSFQFGQRATNPPNETIFAWIRFSKILQPLSAWLFLYDNAFGKLKLLPGQFCHRWYRYASDWIVLDA